MKKNIVIIILSVVILGLGGYLVYDKANDNKETKVNNVDDKKEVAIVTDLVNGKVIQTYEFGGEGVFELYEDEIPYVKAAIPYVNIETEEVKKLNTKIQNDHSEVIDVIKNNIKVQKTNKGPGYKIVNYNYAIRDNVLFILIESTNGAYRASGSINSKAYYYDLENDKILNTNEVLEKLGKTKEQVIGNMDLFLEENKEQIQNDLDNSISIFVVGNHIFVIPTQPYTFNTFQI